MAQIYTIHPQTPQKRTLEAIAAALRSGAVMLYPTDTVYAIGCDLQDKTAIRRVRQIKSMANEKPLTFLCSSLSNIAEYAVVSDEAYRLMKRLIPGPYTFILPASREVPKLVMNPKRRTSGIRVPDHEICQGILQALGNPIISSSAHLPDGEGDFPTLRQEKARLFDALEHLVDVIVDVEGDGDLEPGSHLSTILDLTRDPAVAIRRGMGWQELQSWVEIEEAEEDF